jgi:hypothetical protein
MFIWCFVPTVFRLLGMMVTGEGTIFVVFRILSRRGNLMQTDSGKTTARILVFVHDSLPLPA